MTRFTLLQFRAQALAAAAGLIVVAVALGLTGPHLAHLHHVDVANCAASNDCGSAVQAFLQQDHLLQIWLDILVIVVPGIIGLFWGAPLVARELDSGTYRLAWSQSVTRERWLGVKFAVVGGASTVLGGLLSLIVTWWSRPLDKANMNVFSTFDQRDVVPLGYAAFAFALGATVGIIIKRAIPAMALTLAVFVFIRVAFDQLVRSRLMASVRSVYALSLQGVGFGSENGGSATLLPNPPVIPNAWVYSEQIVNKAGQALSPATVARLCPKLVNLAQGGAPQSGGGGILSGHHVSVRAVPAPGQAQSVLRSCIAKVGATYHEVVSYQPASHYWPMQWRELAAYLVASVAVAGLGLWWARQRLF